MRVQISSLPLWLCDCGQAVTPSAKERVTVFLSHDCGEDKRNETIPLTLWASPPYSYQGHLLGWGWWRISAHKLRKPENS